MIIHKIKDIDIPFIFKKNIFTNDVNLIKGNQAIKHSLKNLILTRHGERPFTPTIGSILNESLFGNITSKTETTIKNSIYQVLSRYESRIKDVGIQFSSETNKKMIINIVYKNIGQDEIQTLDIIL